ncbi:MAG: hypothetical protein GOP50_11750 [Candidatus Heimdallarchaeota archaeon]|nr:hypothetical protein [Candidatus Heimdallarchaeota archaeon]
MQKIYKSLLTLGATIILLSVVIIFAQLFNTDFGNVNVQSVRIQEENISIAGYLYEPKNAETLTNLPAVVLVHGSMNAKEPMTALALELARNGIVALSIDALRHGGTVSTLDSEDDPTLGAAAAVRYLKSLDYVNSSNIGLVGHSMGVGAIRATSIIEDGVRAHIFLGGIYSNSSLIIYGELNETSPSNLLVVIGEYDALFDLQEVNDILQPVFGTTETIEVGVLYGNFTNGTARKLITPKTTHLFEPISGDYINESVSWMANSFGIIDENKEVLYPYRDISIFFGFFIFAGLFIPLSNIGMEFEFFRRKKEEESKDNIDLESVFGFWSIGTTWSFLHLILFVPPILLFGMRAIILPLSLGFTSIFWVLSLSIVGALIIFIRIKLKHKKLGTAEILRHLVKKLSNWRTLLLAVNCFLIMFSLDLILEQIPGISMKLMVPLFSEFTGMRALMFLVLVPFMFIYFIMDGFISVGIYEKKLRSRERNAKLWSATQVTSLKLLPLILVLFIQYVPMLISGFQLFTGFLGFSMQFIIMLLPLFLIYSVATLWFYEKTKSVGSGALFNALMFAWTLSILLPIN